jgi:hypothetical protein
MTYFDVFNGDADGICALHQLRLADPTGATLVTGVKHDIALLKRVNARAGDAVTVLDVSLDVNRKALLDLLERGVTVRYFDHHGSGEVPEHPSLQAVIDTAPDVCTGILVDRHLGGAHRIWAVVAAFGDNLAHSARALAAPLALTPAQIDALQELGECLNYNAYGDSETDLVMPPAALYALLHRHADPFDFIDTEPVFAQLREARRHDMEMARRLPPAVALPCGNIVVLPDAHWSRRVRGTYGNRLAIENPALAHAILTSDRRNGYVVSVRAPLAAKRGADRLCRLFHGGGRPAAAGINHLPQSRLPAFIHAFEQAFRLASMNDDDAG